MINESTPTHTADDEERDDAVIGIAFRYSLLAILLIAVCVGIAYAILREEPQAARPQVEAPTLPEVRAQSAIEPPTLPFTDITETAGITFIHENGAAGEKLLPETMGGGCAFFDFDTDGDPDILFVDSRRWPWDEAAGDAPHSSIVLYANNGSGRFSDVTESAGLDVPLYGQGCAVGDYDNDGDPDLFISAVAMNETELDRTGSESGPHRLFRNDDGRFVDVTEETGVAGRPGAWGTSCGWFDYDRDADLDLWVCHYVEWSREFDLAQGFTLTGSERAYGRPQNFPGTYNRLFRNDGTDGFTDVSEQAGIQIDNPLSDKPMAKSLGLTFADFDADGWPDVVVANDTVQNFLFHNQRDGTFQEIGAQTGIAFDSAGQARGAMGLDVGCTRNGTGCFAVAIGNFSNEMTAYYVSPPGALQFTDEAIANGLGPNTRLQLTFGVFFFDVDLDGRLDLFAANGHLEEDISLVQASQTYEQPPQLFWNAGPESATEFIPLTAEQCGTDFFEPLVGRGASHADIDADGDLDILIATTGRHPRLLRNDQQLDHRWLRLRLTGNGETSNRDAIGARVDLVTGDETLTQFVMPTRSYLSQTEKTLTFGLGEYDAYEHITITWPDGSQQRIDDLQLDREHELRQP